MKKSGKFRIADFIRRGYAAPYGFRMWGAIAIAMVVFAIPVRAYVTQRLISMSREIVQKKWKSMPLTWRMNPVRGANIIGTREQAEVLRTSFRSWSQLTTASISFTEGAATEATVLPAYDGINVVTTNLTQAQYAQRGGGSALGLTLVFAFQDGGPNIIDDEVLRRPVDFAGQILEADIMFNPGTIFTTNTTTVADRTDFESVATHEIGHFLGLDHSGLVSATMFPTIGAGFNYAKNVSTDDIAGISTIYPAASFATKGTLSGTVRTTGNLPVYGAIVVAVNTSGQPVASAITDPSGQYTIAGLDSGAYTVYAEPMDQPFTIGNVGTLPAIYPGQTVNSNFATRYR